ncbi:MAG: hypothetical protein V1850_02595 [Candidatus Bathyarchaeota archaeon]
MVVYRILRWEDFERHILDLKPSTIFYQKDKHPLRNPPIGLRLTFYNGEGTYAFIDFANGSTLYKTGIPVKPSAVKDEGLIDDADIIRFLSARFKNTVIRSMGTFSRG